MQTRLQKESETTRQERPDRSSKNTYFTAQLFLMVSSYDHHSFHKLTFTQQPHSSDAALAQQTNSTQYCEDARIPMGVTCSLNHLSKAKPLHVLSTV
jgi:hypothetical protein